MNKLKIICSLQGCYNEKKVSKSKYLRNKNNFCSRNCFSIFLKKCNVQKKSGKTRTLKTKNIFLKVIKEKNFILRTNYNNSIKKVKLTCKSCKEGWEAIPFLIINGANCPYCIKKKVNIIKINKEIKDIADKRNLNILKFLKNMQDKLVYSCHLKHKNKCNYAIFKKLKNHCPKCSNTTKDKVFLEKNFIKLVESNNEKILKLSSYNLKTNISILCPNNHVYVTKIRNYKTNAKFGSICPDCNVIWKNETHCKNVLEDIFGFKFKKIRSWINHRNYKRIELDGYNKKIKIAFEYNGEQHYKENSYYSNNRTKNIKKLDRLKKRLAKKQGINLITIPYTIKNIRSYIVNWLKRIGKIPLEFKI